MGLHVPSLVRVCAEGSGYVLITLLVMGEVSVEYTVVVDITNGAATGECSGT